MSFSFKLYPILNLIETNDQEHFLDTHYQKIFLIESGQYPGSIRT